MTTVVVGGSDGLPATMSDRELWRRAVDGESEAFGALFVYSGEVDTRGEEIPGDIHHIVELLVLDRLSRAQQLVDQAFGGFGAGDRGGGVEIQQVLGCLLFQTGPGAGLLNHRN